MIDDLGRYIQDPLEIELDGPTSLLLKDVS